MSTKTQEFEEVLVAEDLLRNIVVFNDDINTFDHVIDTFVDVLGHDPMQAQQCAFIIHTKGKCKVKTGDYDALVPMCSTILERGINAEIN